MNIQLITMWYNEEFLAPFFLNHYNWVDTIHILLDADTSDRTEQIARHYPNVEIEHFQFPDMMDSIIKSTAISQKYLSLTGADYVLVVDSDEFIFPFDLTLTVREHLAATRLDAYFVNLWQIYKHESDPPLDPSIPIYSQRRHGDPDMETPENIGYIKPIVVRGGQDIFWGIGNHYIVRNGIKLEWQSRHLAEQAGLKVATERKDLLQGAHWRLVDLNQTIHRQITEQEIVREYEAHKHDPVVIPVPKQQLPDIPQLELLKLHCQEAANLASKGNQTEAQTLYRACLQIMPGFHDARINLAHILGCNGDFDAACKELTLVLCDDPDNLKARIMLGNALLKLGRADQALEQRIFIYHQNPADLDAIHKIAEALYSLQRYDEARKWIGQVLVLQPDDYASLQTLATIERTENPERALSLYRQMAQQRPDDHQTRLFYATLLLSLGNFEEGWREFEQRIPTLKMSDDILSIPRWHGQALPGKKIVLVAEQGHGDALQFIRYATLVAQQGARVMVLCHNDQIRPVLKAVAGVEIVVIPKEPLPFMPDYHCPLMSLPFELGTTIANIPGMPGYLNADRVKQAVWRERFRTFPGLKVGIVWAGNRAQADNGKRSVPFNLLRGLLPTPGVTFFSLQVGPDALKNQYFHESLPLIDWSDELHDFSDTAALVSCLDLVISICSGVTHLSGGLGIPTWVMLQYDADWRWLRDRDDTPWYPGMLLFRQKQPGGWEELLERVRYRLQKRAAEWVGVGNEVSVGYSENSATELYQAGVTAFHAGNSVVAEKKFHEALESESFHSDSLNGLGTIHDLRGETETAIALYRRALDCAPATPLFLFNLANTLRKGGVTEEAEQLYRQAIKVDPEFYQAYGGLGNLLLQNGHPEEAEALLLQSLEINGNQPDSFCDLGVLAGQRDDTALAEQRFLLALKADPGHPAALNHLGMLLMRLNRLEEGEACLRRAVAAKPGYQLAMNNLGVLLHWAGRLEESEACHRSVIAAQPDNGTAHFNLALVLLSQGKFAEGWPEYEYRFRKENPVALRHTVIRRWDGEDISGVSILVHAEQGYGDTIQFARYLPLLAQRGCLIWFECQDRIIAPLFEGMPCLEVVIARGEALPEVDFQIPLMSLPLVLGEAAWREPVSVKYLVSNPDRAALWSKKLAGLPGQRVGLVWSGRRGQDNNHNRMIPPETFARLAGIDGISFVNLLVGIDDPQADAVLADLNMFDARPMLHDFADTAALLTNLDLLVSVDTATSHLAGALGLNTWVMIPYNADWRWTFGLPGCPLYPPVTLYRQEKPFAWEPVLDAIRKDLVNWCQRDERTLQEMLVQARAARDEFQWEPALAWYLRALDADQLNHDALFGVGACLQMLNRAGEALAWYDTMLSLLPDDVTLHCNRALTLLTLGRYPEGWQELQWRKRMIADLLPPIPMLTPEVMQNIQGKRLLLHAEQGFGDTIHMIRYAPLLAERGVRVMVSVPAELVRLVSFVPGVEQTIPHGELLPNADFQALMMDLPWLFGTTVETIPVAMPYLQMPDNVVAPWHERVGCQDSYKVGLVWACGGENQLNRKLRSLPFEQIQKMLEDHRDTQFYSLQIGESALTPQQVEKHINLHDMTGIISDFTDTAALVSCLDHVITIDSAVAHLAGALGKPVSLLLPPFQEWRWAGRQGYSLWYPTVQIFSNTLSGDWDKTFLDLKQHISSLQNSLASRKSSTQERACRLCHYPATCFYEAKRSFFICGNCGLIFSDSIISNEESEQHYCNQHDIEFDHTAYAKNVLVHVGNRIKINRILDYGCGSGRLAKSFKDLGYVVDCYEPMFDGEFNPEGYPYKYDLIIANQVVEHVADIIAFFYNLNLACSSPGILYIATLTTDSILNDPQYFTEKFHAWWYKDDLTHISFFCLNTFEYICESVGKDNFHIIGYGANGIMLQKIKH